VATASTTTANSTGTIRGSGNVGKRMAWGKRTTPMAPGL
jgi:hypothetical protein